MNIECYFWDGKVEQWSTSFSVQQVYLSKSFPLLYRRALFLSINICLLSFEWLK